MMECVFYDNAKCMINKSECPVKKRNFITCCGFVGVEIDYVNPKRQRPEIDPDWVEFVNATNERYKDAR